MQQGSRRLIGVLVPFVLALAACGTAGDDSVAADVSGEVTGSTRSADTADGDAGADLGDTSTIPSHEVEATTGGATAPSDAAATDESFADRDAGASRDDVAPSQQVGLTAGSVDDNVDWEQYLQYRRNFQQLGIAYDDLAVEGRRILTVVDADDSPVHDARIEISDGNDITLLRTGSDGRVIYLAPTDGQRSIEIRAASGDLETTVDLDDDPAQTIALPGIVAASEIKLDLLFLIDATGSMSDEIDRLKSTMVDVAQRIADSPTAPDVRFALTHYRDEGDEYLVRTVDFTGDVGGFVQRLRGISADGGGDMPEAFNQAFEEAITRPAWRTDERVVRLVVLLADAPPHVGVGRSYVETLGDAMANGVRVFPIASSGTDDQAEFIFRQIAQAAFGRFVFLTYGADGAALGGSTDIHERDYDVLALDDLVVRLVEEQLQPLAGDDQQ